MLTKKLLIETLAEYPDDIEIVFHRKDLQVYYMNKGYATSRIGVGIGNINENVFILFNYTPEELEELQSRINFEGTND